MLDVGLYAHPQRRGKNQVMQVDFLDRDDSHRTYAIRTQPIYDIKETYTANSLASPFDAPQVASEDNEGEKVPPLPSSGNAEPNLFDKL